MNALIRVALTLTLAAPLAASVVLPLRFESLSRIASQVVGGEIVKIESFRNADNGYIYSDVTLRLSRALPARPGESAYTFRMIGGELDGRRLFIADMPRFRTGDEVVLFLADATDSVLGPTVGLWQGVFFIERDARTGESRILDHQRRPILDFRNGRIVRGLRLSQAPTGVAAASPDAQRGVAPEQFFERIRGYRLAGAGAR